MQVSWSEQGTVPQNFLREQAPGWLDGPKWYAHFIASAVTAQHRPCWLQVELGQGAQQAWPLQLGREEIRRVPITVLSSLANYYTMRWAPLANPPDSLSAPPGAAWWPAVAQALLGRGAALIRLEPIEPDAAWLGPLCDALRGAGAAVEQDAAFANWRANVTGQNFDDYFAQRPARVRNTWRRKARALARQGAVAITVFDDEARLDEATRIYQHIYAQSWKPAEAHGEFIPGLIQLAAREQGLRLGVLSLAGRPIAVQLWLRDGAHSTIYKLAQDPAFDRYSPGLQLLVAMIRHAIEVDRIDWIDFGSGDDAYKCDWMTERRDMLRISAWNRHTVTGFVAAAARKITQRRVGPRGRMAPNPGK